MTATDVQPPDGPSGGPGFEPEEFRARQRAMGERAADAGLDAVMVWGRGGGRVDDCVALSHLTGYYPEFPAIPDLPGRWRGRGTAVALVLPDGTSHLVSDDPGLPDLGLPVTTARGSVDVPAAAYEALLGLTGSAPTVGLVGRPWVAHRDVGVDLGPRARLVDANPAADDLRRVKSIAEQAALRRAARVGKTVVEAMREGSKAGRTEADVVAAGVAVLMRAGGTLANVFFSATGPDGPHLDRRLPTFDHTRPIERGDLAVVDVSATVGGYLFDFSRSWVVEAEPTAAQEAAMQVPRDVIGAAVEAAAGGVTVEALVHAAAQRLPGGVERLESDEFPALGHGLGIGFDVPWLVSDSQEVLLPGMVLSLERAGTFDGWFTSYEDEVLITASGAEVLTRC